jgi:hypothetical protein
MWSDTPVVTPSGERTTAREWAAELGLFYAPSILFFDERGSELLGSIRWCVSIGCATS